MCDAVDKEDFKEALISKALARRLKKVLLTKRCQSNDNALKTLLDIFMKRRFFCKQKEIIFSFLNELKNIFLSLMRHKKTSFPLISTSQKTEQRVFWYPFQFSFRENMFWKRFLRGQPKKNETKRSSKNNLWICFQNKLIIVSLKTLECQKKNAWKTLSKSFGSAIEFKSIAGFHKRFHFRNRLQVLPGWSDAQEKWQNHQKVLNVL